MKYFLLIEKGFKKANSDNLPKIGVMMLRMCFTLNTDSADFRNIKTVLVYFYLNQAKVIV